MRLKKFLLIEGGNAITSSSRLNQANAPATLDNIFKKVLPLLKLDRKDVEILGSILKKVAASGDIDMAVSIPAILANNKQVVTIEDMYEFVETKMKEISREVVFLRGFGVVSLAFPISNTDGQQKNQFVQLDLMLVDSTDWAKFMYHAPYDYESKYKGVYRNFLMFSTTAVLSQEVTKEVGGYPVELEKMIIVPARGLEKVTNITKPGNKTWKTVKREMVSDKPEIIIQKIFGKDVTLRDFNSFESLLSVLQSPRFPHKDKLDDIYKKTIDYLKKSKIAIPEELAEYA